MAFGTEHVSQKRQCFDTAIVASPLNTPGTYAYRWKGLKISYQMVYVKTLKKLVHVDKFGKNSKNDAPTIKFLVTF